MDALALLTLLALLAIGARCQLAEHEGIAEPERLAYVRTLLESELEAYTLAALRGDGR
jgi:hypothetical protein